MMMVSILAVKKEKKMLMKIWRRKDCDKKTELSNVIDPNNAHLTLTLWLQGSCEWGGLSGVMFKMQCQSIVDDVKLNRGVLFWGGSGTLALLLVVLISLCNNILLYMMRWIYDMLLMNFKQSCSLFFSLFSHMQNGWACAFAWSILHAQILWLVSFSISSFTWAWIPVTQVHVAFVNEMHMT